MEILIGESRRLSLTFHHNLPLKIADKIDLFSGQQWDFAKGVYETPLEMVD